MAVEIKDHVSLHACLHASHDCIHLVVAKHSSVVTMSCCNGGVSKDIHDLFAQSE